MRCEGRACAWTSLAGSVVVALCACGGGGAGSSFTPIDITAAAPAAPALEGTKMAASTTAAEAPPEDQDSATTADKFANSDAASLTDEKKSTGGPKAMATGQTTAEVLSTATLAAAPSAKNPEK